MYFDKNGKSIDVATWEKLFANLEYKIIRQDKLPTGKYISTVWIGLSNLSLKNPLIFETMVFESETWLNMDEKKYSTLIEAIKGHNKMVRKYIGKKEDYQLYKLKE